MAVETGSYKPPRREMVESRRILYGKGYPYKEQLGVLMKSSRANKIAGLVEILEGHHRKSLVHTFEDALLAVTFAQDVFRDMLPIAGFTHPNYRNEYLSKIIKVFEGSLVHDIGKTGVDTKLLNTNNKSALTAEERHHIRLHGTLGGVILHELGLYDLEHFSYEHNLGSGPSGTWKPEQLKSRHELTEIVALADLIGGLLDPRRPYHTPATKEYVLSLVEIKGKQGIYSEKLMKAFIEKVAAKDLYPPFNREDYEKNELFMTLTRVHGITDIFERVITEDQLTRSDLSTMIKKS